jgi:hypothetical protein
MMGVQLSSEVHLIAHRPLHQASTLQIAIRHMFTVCIGQERVGILYIIQLNFSLCAG